MLSVVMNLSGNHYQSQMTKVVYQSSVEVGIVLFLLTFRFYMNIQRAFTLIQIFKNSSFVFISPSCSPQKYGPRSKW